MTDYLDSKISLSDPNFARTYDELPLWSAPFGLLLLEHIPLRRGTVALDVGCGTGFPLVELAGRLGPEARVYGLDPWGEALEQVKQKADLRRLRNIIVTHGTSEAMPFEASFFDLIVSNVGLNNFSHAERAMSECFRVLKPGGTLAITSNLVGHFEEFYRAFEEVLEDASALTRLRTHVAQRATEAKVAELFQQAGIGHVRTVHSAWSMRFADGTALFNHPFIQVGFLDSWKTIVGPENRSGVFKSLERRLNEISQLTGELRLSIPMAYFEGRK